MFQCTIACITDTVSVQYTHIDCGTWTEQCCYVVDNDTFCSVLLHALQTQYLCRTHTSTVEQCYHVVADVISEKD